MTDARVETDELERVATRYDALARDPRRQRAWAATNPGNAAIRAELLDAIWSSGVNSGSILDAGCGGGWWLHALLDRGVPPERLHGVELLPRRVEAARTLLPPNIDVRPADVRELPHPNESFDAVLLLTVLSSLAGAEDVRRALREAARVTRTGGLVLIYEPRSGWPRGSRATHVPIGLIRSVLPVIYTVPVTVWPPAARRLRRFTPSAYRLLAGRRWATSHRLVICRGGMT